VTAISNSSKNYKTFKLLHVTGYWKPGKGLEEITNTEKKETDELTKKEMVVVWGAPNNISKSSQKMG